MKVIVSKVRCCDKTHTINVVADDDGLDMKVKLVNHPGVHREAAQATVALGGDVRCLEIEDHFARALVNEDRRKFPSDWAYSMGRLPPSLREVVLKSFNRAYERQQKRTPKARSEKRAKRYAAKLKEIDATIKRLTTRRRKLAASLKRTERTRV